MKNKIYPSNLTQSLILIFVALIITTPILAIGLAKLYSIEVETNIIIIFLLLSIIILTKYINYRRGNVVDFILKPDFDSFELKIIFICSFQIACTIPVTYLLKNIFPSQQDLQPIAGHSVLSLLSIIIFGPILEEVFFRGIILKGYLSNYSPLKAIIISALLFGIVHAHPVQIIGACIFGFFVGIFFLEKKNVGNMIILHSVVNLTTMVFKNHLFGINYMPGPFSLSIFVFFFFLCSYCLWRLIVLKKFVISSSKGTEYE